MSDGSLKGLPWRQNKKSTLMWHWKGYYEAWRVTEKAAIVLEHMFLLIYRWNYYPLLEPINGHHEGRSIHTYRSQTMGRKAPEPWSPRCVRQQIWEMRNGLPPNDLNHDEKPLAGAERPLCKCDLECQNHMSIDYDTYDMRYWSCPQPSYLFHWGWDFCDITTLKKDG
jgi:hypothetical protein